jgi:hypothetical protein
LSWRPVPLRVTKEAGGVTVGVGVGQGRLFEHATAGAWLTAQKTSRTVVASAPPIRMTATRLIYAATVPFSVGLGFEIVKVPLLTDWSAAYAM